MTPKQRSIDSRLVEWLEDYRIVIGAGLVLLILAGAMALSLRKQQAPQTVEQQLNELREQNEQLKKQLEEIAQAKEATGQVAGTKASAPKSQPARTTSSRQPQSGLININTANQAALESLPRIGPAIANRIIEYRETHGAFRTIEEIKDVKGIGDKTFEQLRDKITVD